MAKKYFYFIMVTVFLLAILGCNKKNPVSPTAPYTPNLSSPLNGAFFIGADPIMLCWYVVTSGPTTYTLQISKDNSFTDMVKNQSGLTNTHYSVSGLDTAITYYWRVNATNSYGTSDWSIARSFSIPFLHVVVDTIPVGDNPDGIIALPNGDYVYVANNGKSVNGNSVSVIRTSDNSVIATIPVGDNITPCGITALPNGDYVYVSNDFSGNVSVIRTSDNTVVTTIEVGGGSSGITALPNGDCVYVANNGNSVSVIRTSDNSVIATIPVGDDIYPCGITALPNGEYVYVSNMCSYNVSVIRTSDNTVVATIPIEEYYGMSGITALPNGEYVYVTHGNNVSVIRTSDNTVMATIPIEEEYYGMSGITALPNGDYVYVTNSESNNVFVLRTFK